MSIGVRIGSSLVYPFEAWGDFLDDGLNWEDRRSELSGVQCMGYLRMMWSLGQERVLSQICFFESLGVCKSLNF
jgi:hypothetical protein